MRSACINGHPGSDADKMNCAAFHRPIAAGKYQPTNDRHNDSTKQMTQKGMATKSGPIISDAGTEGLHIGSEWC